MSSPQGCLPMVVNLSANKFAPTKEKVRKMKLSEYISNLLALSVVIVVLFFSQSPCVL